MKYSLSRHLIILTDTERINNLDDENTPRNHSLQNFLSKLNLVSSLVYIVFV